MRAKLQQSESKRVGVEVVAPSSKNDKEKVIAEEKAAKEDVVDESSLGITSNFLCVFNVSRSIIYQFVLTH